ncbi:Putative fatty-acid--CoA ligase FadD21 (Acyl-CoA synthetase), partial [Durusdinium trenchii]
MAASKDSFVQRLRHFGVEDSEVRDRKTLIWVDAKCKEVAAMTAGQFVRKAAAVAKALSTDWGCQPGDKILLVFIPGLEFLVGFVACLIAGMVAVPIYPPNPRSPAKGMQILLNAVRMTQPKVALSHASFLSLKRFQLSGPKYPKDLTFHNISKLGELEQDKTSQIFHNALAMWAAPDRLVLIQFSSGSTGDPKPIAISASNLDANLSETAVVAGGDTSTVVGTWVPFYHDAGLVLSCCLALYCGAANVMTSPMSFLTRPTVWLEMMSKFKVNKTFGPNFALEMCVNKVPESALEDLDLSTCNRIVVAAEPVRNRTLQRFVSRFGPCGINLQDVYPSYGAAENVVAISSVPQSPTNVPLVVKFDPNSLQVGAAVTESADQGGVELVGNGMPIQGTELRVVHPDSLQLLKDGVVGELWLTGTSRAIGYYNRPDLRSAFEAAFAGSQRETFYRTGDIGFLYRGEVFICGRLKDMLIINGKNFFPQDIEHATELGAPEHVRPGCVAAFAITDAVLGTEAAVVVAEVRNPRFPDLHEVAMAIKASIAAIVEIDVQDVVLIQPRSIPKTTSGKIKRKQAKADLAEDKLKVVFQVRGSQRARTASRTASFCAETDEDPETWLCKRAAEVLDVANVSPSDDLFELGLTSMGLMSMSDALNAICGGTKTIENPDTFFREHPTVRQLLDGIESLDTSGEEKQTVQSSLPPVKTVSSMALGPILQPVLE